MKPKKNHNFCVACRRRKMLFESKEEADRFITYNRGEILRGRRKAPIRSYYCEICGGWHVTSNPSKEDAKRLDERDKALAEEVDRRFKMPVWNLEEGFSMFKVPIWHPKENLSNNLDIPILHLKLKS